MPVQVEQSEGDDKFIDFNIANEWAETNRDRVRHLAYGILRLSGTLFLISIFLPFVIIEKYTIATQAPVSLMIALSTIFYIVAVMQSIRTCMFVKEYLISTQRKAIVDILEVLNREIRLVKTASYTMSVGMVLDTVIIAIYMWQVVFKP